MQSMYPKNRRECWDLDKEATIHDRGDTTTHTTSCWLALLLHEVTFAILLHIRIILIIIFYNAGRILLCLKITQDYTRYVLSYIIYFIIIVHFQRISHIHSHPPSPQFQVLDTWSRQRLLPQTQTPLAAFLIVSYNVLARKKTAT
jgi:hypothetical protein